VIVAIIAGRDDKPGHNFERLEQPLAFEPQPGKYKITSTVLEIHFSGKESTMRHVDKMQSMSW